MVLPVHNAMDDANSDYFCITLLRAFMKIEKCADRDLPKYPYEKRPTGDTKKALDRLVSYYTKMEDYITSTDMIVALSTKENWEFGYKKMFEEMHKEPSVEHVLIVFFAGSKLYITAPPKDPNLLRQVLLDYTSNVISPWVLKTYKSWISFASHVVYW